MSEDTVVASLIHLLKGANDADHQVRIHTAISLGSLPVHLLQLPICYCLIAEKIVPSLLRLCDDSIGTVRTAAAKGLSDAVASGILLGVASQELVICCWRAVRRLMQDSKVAVAIH